MEIGSNDGTFISEVKKLGLRAVGVDPAENIGLKAQKQNLPIEWGYCKDKMTQNKNTNFKHNATATTQQNTHLQVMGASAEEYRPLLDAKTATRMTLNNTPQAKTARSAKEVRRRHPRAIMENATGAQPISQVCST